MTQFHTLVIADLRRETDDAVSVAFDVPPDLAADFAFTPGQYLTLRTRQGGAELRRSYSICAGLDDGELRVAIKHVPGGAFSTFANTRLHTGDTLDVMPAQGRFGVVPGQTRTYLGLAAGSGITPILSILKSVLTREPDSRFVLIYGNRRIETILFREQLEDLKDRFLGRLVVQHVLSREAQDVPSFNGRLDAGKLRSMLPALLAPAEIDLAFLCGPETMIDSLRTALEDLGVPRARILSERFTSTTPPSILPTPAAADAPALAADEVPTRAATIIHEGRSTDITLDPGESILDAGLRAGLNLPWSCHGGMCSTCRARVTDGHASMEVNFALEPWETAQGYVLTCQARPDSAQIVVDYDQV